MGDVVVRADEVWKKFRLYHERNQSLKAMVMRRGRATYEDFWALKDVSFEVPAGTTFALVGHNGSGKSTMLKTLARILRPDQGSVEVKGKVSALLELGAGFHPELSGPRERLPQRRHPRAVRSASSTSASTTSWASPGSSASSTRR